MCKVTPSNIRLTSRGHARIFSDADADAVTIPFPRVLQDKCFSILRMARRGRG